MTKQTAEFESWYTGWKRDGCETDAGENCSIETQTAVPVSEIVSESLTQAEQKQVVEGAFESKPARQTTKLFTDAVSDANLLRFPATTWDKHCKVPEATGCDEFRTKIATAALALDKQFKSWATNYSALSP